MKRACLVLAGFAIVVCAARAQDGRTLTQEIKEISYRPLRGRYEEGPSKGPSISQVPVSPVSSRLLPASGCNRG